MTSYTQVFGGNTISTTQVGYRAIALTENKTLVWPLNATADADICAQKLNVTPDASGRTITMPSALLVSVGQDVLITNLTAYSFTLLNSAGGTIASFAASEAKYVYLTDNSTAAGTWTVIQYGVGSSNVDAAALAGLGIEAIGTTLNSEHVVSTKNAAYTVVANDRASTVRSTAGAISFTFTAAATLTTGWFCLVRNDGSGTLTLDPNGAETIDGAATKALAVGESCFVVSDGSNLYTVGYGRSTTATVTALAYNIAGTGTVTQTAAEAASQVQNFTGLLTGNRIINMGTNAAYWFIYNNTTGAFTVTCRADGADAGVAVTQGSYAILRSDGVNVRAAITAASGTVTSVATGTGLTGGPITTTGTIALANTTVVAGSYTAANVTFNAQGQATAASNGTATVITTYTSAAQTLTASSTTTLAHGLGAVPKRVYAKATVKTGQTDLGWADTDAAQWFGPGPAGASSDGFTMQADATNVHLRTAPNAPIIVTKTASTVGNMTLSKWDFTIVAEYNG